MDEAANIKLSEVLPLRTDEFPDKLDLRIPFGNLVGDIFEITGIRRYEDEFQIEYYSHPNLLKKVPQRISVYFTAFLKAVEFHENLYSDYNHVDDEGHQYIIISYKTSNTFDTIENLIGEGNSAILDLKKEVDVTVNGFQWKNEYDTDEKPFTLDVVLPLLRRMKFNFVKYTHGTNEYGKDIVFSEFSKFGQLKYHAMQVKPGNVGGGAKGKIKTLIEQAESAFSIPYTGQESRDEMYISSFTFVISGKFSEEAKREVLYRVPEKLKGTIHFIDKEKVLELIERYWVI
ncbi:hypothetical protein [Tunicatimonas pelagia]|uniref:hypothetical protein n=1 Tax=Tunicatimonas pelagia TaxID=931531 RepID=UPI002666C379|nr:hypothetical protein [Tunicatimonas pelagia]WKN41536.1 hypothetical protein P0M28_21100 [Tunicatimonas pelagia]